MPDSHSYEEGILKGRVDAMERILNVHETHMKNMDIEHKESMRHLDSRLRLMEKILWGLLGAIALIQIMPIIQGLLGA